MSITGVLQESQKEAERARKKSMFPDLSIHVIIRIVVNGPCHFSKGFLKGESPRSNETKPYCPVPTIKIEQEKNMSNIFSRIASARVTWSFLDIYFSEITSRVWQSRWESMWECDSYEMKAEFHWKAKVLTKERDGTILIEVCSRKSRRWGKKTSAEFPLHKCSKIFRGTLKKKVCVVLGNRGSMIDTTCRRITFIQRWIHSAIE